MVMFASSSHCKATSCPSWLATHHHQQQQQQQQQLRTKNLGIWGPFPLSFSVRFYFFPRLFLTAILFYDCAKFIRPSSSSSSSSSLSFSLPPPLLLHVTVAAEATELAKIKRPLSISFSSGNILPQCGISGRSWPLPSLLHHKSLNDCF